MTENQYKALLDFIAAQFELQDARTHMAAHLYFSETEENKRQAINSAFGPEHFIEEPVQDE